MRIAVAISAVVLIMLVAARLTVFVLASRGESDDTVGYYGPDNQSSMRDESRKTVSPAPAGGVVLPNVLLGIPVGSVFSAGFDEQRGRRRSGVS